MHRQKCYNTCHRYFGKVVKIEDIHGDIHIGRIVDITRDSVWIERVHRPSFDTGFGYSDTRGRGCDFCGGLSPCDHCGFGFRDNREFDFRDDCCRGFGGNCGSGWDDGCRGFGCELAFGFIFGITLAALFFI